MCLRTRGCAEPRISWLLLGLLLLVAGCHKLLGDFTVEEIGVSCKSGGWQCVSNVLQLCNSEGTGWENRDLCASAKLCDPKGGACLPSLCATGERRCQGAELQVCNATRDGWALLDTCETAGRCSAGSDTCTEPCQPGTLQCNGALLQTCRADQLGWDDVPNGQCGSAALCNEKEGKCEAAVCQPGTFNCAGSVRECFRRVRSLKCGSVSMM